MIVVSIVKGIADHFPKRVTNWMLSGMLANIGFVLINRPGLFYEQPTYAFMVRLGSSDQWGVACVVLGGLRLMALVVNGTFAGFRWSAHCRSVLSSVTCLVWLQLVLGCQLEGSTGLGVAVYPFLLFLEIYDAFSAAQEAGVVERVHNEKCECVKAMGRLDLRRERGGGDG